MLDRPTVCLSYFNPCPYVCPSSFPPIRITFIQQPKRLIISSLSAVCLYVRPPIRMSIRIYTSVLITPKMCYSLRLILIYFIFSQVCQNTPKTQKKSSTYHKRMANKNTEKVYAYMFVGRRYETKLITLL